MVQHFTCSQEYKNTVWKVRYLVHSEIREVNYFIQSDEYNALHL